MALTIANREFLGAGNRRAVVLNVTFDSSYATGGEDLTPASLGMKKVDSCTATPQGGLIFEYDYTNKKLQAFFPTGGSADAATVTDPVVSVPSGSTAVLSTGAQPNLVETSGRGKEVNAAVDLSGITTRVYAVGY